jgi:hypothetical protein
MREYCAEASAPAPWPGVPLGSPAPVEGQARDLPTSIAEFISAIGDTRWLFLISGALLAADIFGGAAATMAVMLGRHGAVVVGTVGLLIPVALSWLVAAALLLWAERSVADAIGELRWVTGAPLDLAAPPSPRGVDPAPEADLAWSYVVRLIGAVAIRHGRARLALCAAILATAGFFAWAVLSLAIAAVI